MNFNDVEATRQRYFAKSQAISKKRKKVITIFLIIAFIIDIFLLVLNFDTIKTLFVHPSVQSAISIIMPTMIIIIFELVLSFIIAHLATINNNITEEYQDYKRAYKKYFVSRQLASIFTKIDYNHELGLDKELLQETGLIYTGDVYRSNDLVHGEYNNVSFTQADVTIEEVRKTKDADGHTETKIITIFNGRYLIFTFPKKFDYKMVISFNGYGESYINPKTKRGLRRIETESTEFNKRFLVYAEDEFEAFYILNPTFIENLEKLGQQYDNNLVLYFSDNKLYIGLNDNGDIFEPPDGAAPIDERKELAKVTNDMQLVINLIDNLKLNR
ncbi:DUF3137 domain-containing protein [Candidatus Saccharibacteria bacterium]|nr:DUF3137 domain-containing protein [Candidatus Saccharibacteria bacterium]